MKSVMKIMSSTSSTLSLLLFLGTLSHSLPLSTNSRWIVDATSGRRVKLACVNWPGHLHAMVPEGLHKKPLTHIAAFVSSMGFNCVRLTWATYMFTRPYFTNLTVEQSLDQWGLEEARAGLARNNPGLLGLTLVEAQKAVVSGLGAQKIMVVLDNHVSYPKWCCHGSDGNGFFGDEYFDPGEWLKGLTTVAKLYKDEPTVVAMSMRNEFRGPRQNENAWYQYIEMGSTAIHKESPNVLVVVSGLSFATNLGFLKKKPLGLNLTSKLVYEAHWYSFSNPTHKWLFQTNGFCATATKWFTDQSGFLISGPSPVPLFVSEFGVDQRGVNERDNRYLGCLLAHLAENDMDWALWTLQGSYMLREGRVGMEEMYGLLDAEWAHVRDPKMLDKLQLVQQMTQDPNSKHPTLYIMYHPQSGQCARVGKNGIYLSDCRRTSKWSHDRDRDGSPIRLKGTSRCLTIAGDGLPAILSSNCSSDQSTWGSVSDSKLHMAAKDEQGRYLCLEWSSLNFSAILTKKCLCLGDDLKDAPKCVENPQVQWFKLIPTNEK